MTALSSEQIAYNHFIQRWGSATLDVVETLNKEWWNSAAESYRNHSADEEIFNLQNWFNFLQRAALIKV